MNDTTQTVQGLHGRCYLLELPNEIILLIVKMIPSSRYEETHAALASSMTCKLLREVCFSVHFSTLCVDLQKPFALELLRGRADDPCVAGVIKELQLATVADGPRPMASLLPPVLDAVGKMTGLHKIFLSLCILTGTVLDAIRGHPTIQIVDIDGPVTRSTFPLDAITPPPSPSSPPRPLAFELEFGLDDNGFASELVARFQQVGDTVSLAFVVLGSPAIPSFLVELLPSLNHLTVRMDPTFTEGILSSVCSLPTLCNLLQEIVVVVGMERTQEEPDQQTFVLSKSDWIDLHGSVSSSVDEFLNEWKEVLFDSVAVGWTVGAKERPDRVEFVLDYCMISRSMVTSLAQVVQSVRALVFQSRYRDSTFFWKDWDATVFAFDAFTSLERIEFGCAFMSSPSLETAVGCKPECLEIAYNLKPSLRVDLLLIGGPSKLKDLEIRLNVQRLQLLGPHLPSSTEVIWNYLSIGPIPLRTGVVYGDENGGKALWLDEPKRLEDPDGFNPHCLVCDSDLPYVPEDETPIDFLMECSAEEVRSALAFEGFDLDAFDSRSLAGNETPFELFLRSGSAVESS